MSSKQSLSACYYFINWLQSLAGMYYKQGYKNVNKFPLLILSCLNIVTTVILKMLGCSVGVEKALLASRLLLFYIRRQSLEALSLE